jgi:hypothetical protein
MIFRAGLEPAVRAVLARGGIATRTTGQYPGALPEPNLKALRDRGMPVDLPLLEGIRDHDRALVRLSDVGAVDLALLIAQAAVAWPHFKIVVAVARVQEARGLQERLRRYVADTAVLTGFDKPAGVRRVVITTFAYLQCWLADSAGRDLFFAPRALEAVGATCWRSFPLLSQARAYGFLDGQARPSPAEADELRALFGFQEVSVPAHGHRERRVHVVECVVKGGPGIARDADLLKLKRQGLWRHPVRNRRIAHLAAALYRKDSATATGLSPSAAGVLPAGQDLGVFVLVENLEHASALAGELKGWPVFAGPSIRMGGLAGPNPTRWNKEYPLGATPDHGIVTFCRPGGCGPVLRGRPGSGGRRHWFAAR